MFASDLHSYGTKFTKDKALIEDVIHDLFVTLWSSRSRLSQPACVRAYLFKAFRTTLFRKIKQRSLSVSEEAIVNFDFDISIDEKLCRDEQISQIRKEVGFALTKLTPRQRQIIYYRFFKNLEFDQIADIMGMQVRATYKLSARALQNMRGRTSDRRALFLTELN